jgi:hypothetical protein
MQVRVASRCLSGGHLLEQHALCRLPVWRHRAAKGGGLAAVPGVRWNGRVDSHKGVEARRREAEASKGCRGTRRWLAVGRWRALAAENNILGASKAENHDSRREHNQGRPGSRWPVGKVELLGGGHLAVEQSASSQALSSTSGADRWSLNVNKKQNLELHNMSPGPLASARNIVRVA